MPRVQPFSNFIPQIQAASAKKPTALKTKKSHQQLLINIKDYSINKTSDPLDQIQDALKYKFETPALLQQIAKIQSNPNVPKAFNFLGKSILRFLIVERLTLVTSHSEVPNMQLSAALSTTRFADFSRNMKLAEILPDQLTGPPSARQIAENFCQIIASVYLDTGGDIQNLQQLLDPCFEDLYQGFANNETKESFSDKNHFSKLKASLVRDVSDRPQNEPLSEEDVKEIFGENYEAFTNCFPMYIAEKSFDAEFLLAAFSMITGWNKKMGWFGFPLIELVQAEAKTLALLKGQDLVVGQEVVDKKQVGQVARNLGLADLISTPNKIAVDKQIAEMFGAAVTALYVDGKGIHLPGGWLLQNLINK